MNVFGDIRERIQKTDNEMRMLGCAFDGDTCGHHHNQRPKSQSSMRKKSQPRFSSHPQRITYDSDSDMSLLGMQLKGNLSSSTSNLNFERESNFYQDRKKKAQNFREKLHARLTQLSPTYTNVSMENLGSGDSCRVSPAHFDLELKEIYKRQPYRPPEQFKLKGIETPVPKKTILKKEGPAPRAKSSNQLNVQRTMSSVVFEKKMKVIVEKSCQSLNNIRNIMDNGTEPDGDEDISRRELRVKEFCNRFARNYLYPLARQIADLEDPVKNSKNGVFNQKVFSAYQTILNGLQAYSNHLPSSIGNFSYDRLKILLINLLQICDLQSKLGEVPQDKETEDFISSFKLNAEITLQKIDDDMNAGRSTESNLKSSTRMSLPKYADCGKKPKRTQSKNNLEKRLSMYSVTASFRKEAPWKRVVESLAKKKFNVKSKYRTATFKHRPQNQKEENGRNVPKLKSLKKSDILNRTPIASPVHEENIKTMVQFLENHEEKLKEKNEAFQNNEVIQKFLKLIEENKNKAESSQNFMPILEFLQNEKNFAVFTKFVEEMNKKTQETAKLTLEIVNSQSSIPPESGKKKRKEPKVIKEIGEKNARLICLEDENSILEDDCQNNTPVESRDSQTDLQAIEVEKASSQTQTDVNESEKKEKTNKSTQKSLNKIKITRVTKSGRKLQMLSKECAVPAIQYKLDFYRYCKNNPMYKKTENVQPWFLMGKISETLLNQSLLEIAKEIEINENTLINEVFESELQL